MCEKRGFSTPSIEMADIKSALIAASGQRIVLADSTKANKIAFSFFAKPEDIQILITNNDIDRQFADSLFASGVEVVCTK